MSHLLGVGVSEVSLRDDVTSALCRSYVSSELAVLNDLGDVVMAFAFSNSSSRIFDFLATLIAML